MNVRQVNERVNAWKKNTDYEERWELHVHLEPMHAGLVSCRQGWVLANQYVGNVRCRSRLSSRLRP